MSPLGATWGVEPAETATAFPCDRLDGGFDADYYRGVTVHAPPSAVYRWLCQLRAAPYSYDWIDNRGRRSPRSGTYRDGDERRADRPARIRQGHSG